MSNKVILSPSKLDTFIQCSWLYYFTYVLNHRYDEGNDGSKRGSCVHNVLDALLKRPERENYVYKILDSKNIHVIPSIARYLKCLKKKYNLINDFDNKGNNNQELLEEMILVGLEHDFFCKNDNGKLESTEFEFEYTNKEPHYTIRGIIDKISSHEKIKKITDYKTSQSKFEGKKKSFNIQAYIYALYLFKKYKTESVVEFLFLRFKNDPLLKVCPTQDELEGFEYYLEHISNYLQDFNYKKAIANLAYSKGYPKKEEGFCGALACGYGKYPGHCNAKNAQYFVCEAKFPFIYYVLINKKGEIINQSKDEKTLLKLKRRGDKIEPRQYEGCPAHKKLWKDNPELFKGCFVKD